jgi:hypothetical protein
MPYLIETDKIRLGLPINADLHAVIHIEAGASEHFASASMK